MKKSVKILGINSAGFNTSAALIVDGQILFILKRKDMQEKKEQENFLFRVLITFFKQI